MSDHTRHLKDHTDVLIRLDINTLATYQLKAVIRPCNPVFDTLRF